MTSEIASKTTTVGSPRNSSFLDEDLPLYGEFQYSDQNDALPPAIATPAKVADFLLRLVVSTESMSLDQARGVATKWTKGAGKDLLSYPDAMYFQIFGYKNGWIVCREVKMVAHRENMKTFAGKFEIFGVLMFIAWWEMWALIFSVMFVDEVSKGVAYGAAIVGGGASIVALFLVSVDLYQGRRKIVETQLGSELNAVLLRGPRGTAPTVKA